MHSEVYAKLILTSEKLGPKSIGDALKLRPFKSWKTGDLCVPRAIIRHKKNGWSIKSKIPPRKSLEEHVRNVISQAQRRWANFKKMGRYCEVKLFCSVWSYGGDRPAIEFPVEIVQKMAEINARIEVDLYIVNKKAIKNRRPSKTNGD